MTDIKKLLQDSVDRIAQGLSEEKWGLVREDIFDAAVESGWYPDEDLADKNGEWTEYPVGAQEWLEQALSIEVTTELGSSEVKNATILVSYGGPNIWVDTRTATVNGSWGYESATANFSISHADELVEVINDMHGSIL